MEKIVEMDKLNPMNNHELPPRKELVRSLTPLNRRHSDLGLHLRSQYTKLRLLTEEEETTAGKFSHVGKRLDTIKKALTQKLGREPTDDEWANSCKFSTEELYMYIDLATRSRNRLVQHNIRIVDFWARKMMQVGKGAKEVSYYELVTEGLVGLAKAAENFDGRGRFYAYAQFWIRSELYHGITRLRPGSHVSHRSALLNSKANRVEAQLKEILDRQPTAEEVASAVKISTSTLGRVRKEATKIVRNAESGLKSVKPGSESTDESSDFFDLHLKAEQTTFSIETMLWQVNFNNALECLSPMERRTLMIRYGLMDGLQRSVETTAELMCMTSETVRKTIIRAMEKLRDSPSSIDLEEGPPQSPLSISNGRLGAKVY
jgi:RNA polymerase sigma factor (sigma-70 family)